MNNDTLDSVHPIIALQLYTIRDILSQNLHCALEAVHKAGYSYVEIADTYNYSLPEFVKILNEHFIKAISSHIDYLVLQQNPEKILDEAKKAGIKCIVVPWIGSEVWENDSLANDIISTMDNIANIYSREGIQLCYHNHAHEINNSKKINYLDLILEKTTDVYLELDLGWVYVATGENPFNLVEKYNSRIKLFHLKDVAQREPVLFTEFGRGKNINWSKILPDICQINKSPLIIEQDDNFSESSIISAKEGLINLNQILNKI